MNRSLISMPSTGTASASGRRSQRRAGEQRGGDHRIEVRQVRQQPRGHDQPDQECHQQQVRPQVGEVRFMVGELAVIGTGPMLRSIAAGHSIFCGHVMARRSTRAPCICPFRDDAFQRIEPVGQRRRAGLQDQRRLDLAQEAVAHRRDGVEARPRRDLRRHEFLAAPGADDDVGLRPRSPASAVTMRSLALFCAGRVLEHVDAAGGLDQLRHPADAGDHRLVPFLEIDARPLRQRARALRAPASSRCVKRARQRVGLVRARRPARRACGSSRGCRRCRAG